MTMMKKMIINNKDMRYGYDFSHYLFYKIYLNGNLNGKILTSHNLLSFKYKKSLEDVNYDNSYDIRSARKLVYFICG
jgi:hypothetical protein